MRNVLVTAVLAACANTSPPLVAAPQERAPPPSVTVASASSAPPPAPPPKPSAVATAEPEDDDDSAPTSSGGMAVPGPLALPCTKDMQCGTHRCNQLHGKCAFPCLTAIDCARGASCVIGVCAPKPP